MRNKAVLILLYVFFYNIVFNNLPSFFVTRRERTIYTMYIIHTQEIKRLFRNMLYMSNNLYYIDSAYNLGLIYWIEMFVTAKPTGQCLSYITVPASKYSTAKNHKQNLSKLFQINEIKSCSTVFLVVFSHVPIMRIIICALYARN